MDTPDFEYERVYFKQFGAERVKDMFHSSIGVLTVVCNRFVVCGKGLIRLTRIIHNATSVSFLIFFSVTNITLTIDVAMVTNKRNTRRYMYDDFVILMNTTKILKLVLRLFEILLVLLIF